MMQKMPPITQLSYANENVMVAVLSKPSSFIHEIQLEKVGSWNLFKFSEHLQLRMEELLEKKKADQLTTDEIAEREAIGELDRILPHANAMLAAQDFKDTFDADDVMLTVLNTAKAQHYK